MYQSIKWKMTPSIFLLRNLVYSMAIPGAIDVLKNADLFRDKILGAFMNRASGRVKADTGEWIHAR